MHIGFLTPEYPVPNRPDGGLANYLRRVGRQLAERGHQVDVIWLSDREADWMDGPLHIHEVPKVRLQWLRRIPYLRTFALPLGQLLSARRAAARAWQIHRRQRFDILQTPSYLSPGLTLNHNGRVPVVCRISSYSPLYRAAFGRAPSFGEKLSDRLERGQIVAADAVFSPSRFFADTLKQEIGREVAVVRTPVDDLAAYPERDASIYQQHFSGFPYLLFFGTLSRIKGVDLLNGVIADILRQFPQIHFVFVGRDDGLPGGEKVFSYLLRGNPGASGHLHYHPAIPKPQLLPVIAGAVGVLMPSRVDNYPNAVLEAQGLGVPVVGTDRSSLDEMIVDGVTGFIAENGSPESLRRAIERLLSLSPEQRAEMRKHILAHHADCLREDRVAALEDCYRAVIHSFREKR